ncbi:MAG: hypothetical protein KAR38_08145 [Calditrichia bacterium]|nr:hypothetical protein [Calditrichia bacterium]
MGVTNNIQELKSSIENLKKLITELILSNKKLDRENFNLKKELDARIEPEEVNDFKKQLEFYQEREALLKKKVNRLIKRLDNLEIFDAEEEEVAEIESEGILDG